MEITEVRVRLCERDTERFKAYCSITLEDEFVIRDLRVVEGTTGLFVAMPSRRATASCPRCDYKNHLNAKYCNDCGTRLPVQRSESGQRSKAHRDIAHPITPAFREMLQQTVLDAYREECERSKDPDYEPERLDEEETEVIPVAVVEEEEIEEVEGVEEIEEVDEDETDELEESEEETEVVNEYDELIADLRRRTGGSTDRGHERPRESRPAPRPEVRPGMERRPAPPPPRRPAPPPSRQPMPLRGERPMSPPGQRPAPRPGAPKPPMRPRPPERERAPMGRTERPPMDRERTPVDRERPPQPRPAAPPRRETPAMREPLPMRERPASDERREPAPPRPAPSVPKEQESDELPFGAGIL